MEAEWGRRRRGLVTYGGNQSATSINASYEELAKRGVDLDIMHYTRKFSRRLWRHLSSPIQDLHIVIRLSVRRYDFLLLSGADEHMRRPRLLHLLLMIAQHRNIPIYVRWGSCRWLLRNKRRQLGSESFEKSIALLSAPTIRHLALTQQAAHDLKTETGIRESTLIFNSNKLTKDFSTRKTPDNDPPIVINVATVQARKGPDLFVEVAAEVCRQHPTVRFVWIGGVVTPELGALVEDLGVSDRVEFVGKVFPPWEWMLRASALLLTSRSEAFGLCVAEAMACHRTACVFAGTGAADAVGDTGIVVNQFDTDRMACHLLELLMRDPEERINDRARARYDENFAPEPFAERLYNVLLGKVG